MYAEKTVTIALEEVIALDREEFLDLLEELWFADYGGRRLGHLEDISYEVVGHNKDEGTLNLSVRAIEHRMDSDQDAADDTLSPEMEDVIAHAVQRVLSRM